MEDKRDYYDVEYITQQKAINDILFNNNAFSNELIFNYITSRETGINKDELDKKVNEQLLECGIKTFSVDDCKNHLDVLRQSFSSPENAKFFSAYSKDKDYSIELLSDGTLQIIEIDANRKETLKNEIGENAKKLGIIKGGFIANFLHNWKVSTKLATLYVDKTFSSNVRSSIIHHADLRVDDLEKFLFKLNAALEGSISDRRYAINHEDIRKLNSMGVNYADISKEDWIKISKGEIAGPVDMVMGEIKTPVLLAIKDDQIGCYHLNNVANKEVADLSNIQQFEKSNVLSKENNSKQAIGNYLFNALQIVTLGFTIQDFELLKNGQLTNVIMRSPDEGVFGNFQDPNNRMGKVSLEFDTDGRIIGHNIIPRVDQLQVTEYFKGNLLSARQIESLEKNGEVDRAVFLNIDGKENVKGFLSVDSSLNQIVFLAADKISVPSKVNGNEIKEEYRKDLLEGKSVIFYDFRHDGEDINAVVKLNKRSGQLEVEKLDDYALRIEQSYEQKNQQKEASKVLEIPVQFMGYEFSRNDKNALEQKDGLKDAVIVEKNGESVEGFISVDRVKNELVFLAKFDILIDKGPLEANELSKEQRQALVNGYSVLYPDFVSEGKKSTVQIEINRLDGSTKVSPVVSGLSLMESKIEKEKAKKLALEESKKESKAPKIN